MLNIQSNQGSLLQTHSLNDSPQSRFLYEFTPQQFTVDDDEILHLGNLLKKETIVDGVILKNRLKQILDGYIAGESGFESFEELLNLKTSNSNQRIALENLYKEIAPLQYYQEVVKLKISRQQGINRNSISLVDLINEVNEIFEQHQPDSIEKSELINLLIKFYKINHLRILSLDYVKNQKIDFRDLIILPDNFKDSLIEELVLYQLKIDDEHGSIKAYENALLDLMQLNEEIEEISEEKLSIKKTLQEKLFLNFIKKYQLTDQFVKECKNYFQGFDSDLKFKIVSKIWQKTQQSPGDRLIESLLLILRNSDNQNLEDIAFGLLISNRQNLKFDDFKQVVDAFCQNKLSNNPLRSLAVFEDDALEYARQDQVQIDRITNLYLIPTIKNARLFSDSTKASPLRFNLAKYALESFIDNFFSDPSNPLISLDNFKKIVSAIEENNRYPLTVQQFRELCLIYKTINNSQSLDEYATSRGVSLKDPEPQKPRSFADRFSPNFRALTVSNSSSQQLSSATLNTIAKEVKDEIIEAKILLDLSDQKIQDDLSYKLFQKLSSSQLPTNLDQFILELKKELISNDDLKFTDLKKILFYSDRLMQGSGFAEEEISYQLRGLIVFYSQIKLTSFDPKEKKLVKDLLLSYDPDSLNALNPVIIFDGKNLPSRTKFDYITKRQLPADDFVDELSKYYLTQEEIYVLAKRFILDKKEPIADMENFLSQVSELICGSQNQQSKILFKKKFATEIGAIQAIDLQEIDLLLKNFYLREQFLSELDEKLKLIKNHSEHQYQFEEFKTDIVQILNNYVGQDLRDRYLAVQYIAQKINKKIPHYRPWYEQLQNSTFEIVIQDPEVMEFKYPDFKQIESARMQFLVGIKAIIEFQDYSKNHLKIRKSALLIDIKKIFALDKSLNLNEIKLFLNILFNHKIIQNKSSKQFDEGDLENLKSYTLSSIEFSQYPEPDLLQMQSRIVPATKLDDEILTTCCTPLRDSLIKFGSQVYQYASGIRYPFSTQQKLTPEQISKLKILEFVNQMRQADFGEVMSAIALQIDRFKGGLTFHEKADLVIKSVVDYQLSRRDSLEVVGSRILTALKFCSIEPSRLDEDKFNNLKTILTANGIIGNISRNDLVLTSLPNYNHHKLLNDIYSNNLSQLSTASHHISADISILEDSQASYRGINLSDQAQNLSRQRSVHHSSGGPAPINFFFGLNGELPDNSQSSQISDSQSTQISIDSLHLDQYLSDGSSTSRSQDSAAAGVISGGYNSRPLGIRNLDQDSPPPPPPPVRTQAQVLRRARTMQPAVVASEISQDNPQKTSRQLTKVKSLPLKQQPQRERPLIWA